jgi:hypothetical protein
MKNFLTIVSMTLILVTAAAVSAYCGNANGEISGPSSGVRLSVANPSIMVLSQAKPESPETGGKQKSDIPAGLLAAEIAGQDSPGGAGSVAEDKTGIGTPPLGTPGTGDPVPGCTNGKAVGNKHCVATPSE